MTSRRYARKLTAPRRTEPVSVCVRLLGRLTVLLLAAPLFGQDGPSGSPRIAGYRAEAALKAEEARPEKERLTHTIKAHIERLTKKN